MTSSMASRLVAIYVDDKQTLLNWFRDDPRYFMRWRHNEEWTPTIEPRPR